MFLVSNKKHHLFDHLAANQAIISLAPRTEAAGGDPTRVDVRRASVTNKGDAALCLRS
jgi:hypothetical protein